MKKSIYFKLQQKRAFKLYPSILIITLVIITSIALFGVALLNSYKNSDTNVAIRTGVVGDVKDSYLGIGVEAIKNIDSSRFYVDLVNMTETEAKTALKNGEISGYVFIPENFVNDAVSGKDVKVKYITSDDPGAVNKMIEQEVVSAISSIVEESQKNIYAAIDVGKSYNEKGIYKKINKLNLSCISLILNREQIHNLTLLGIKDELTYGGYYLCAVIVFFLSVWGISCNRLITENNYELFRIANLRGIGCCTQTLAKVLSFLNVTYLTLGILSLAFGALAQNFDFGVPELYGADVVTSLIFVIKLFPTVLMFVLMHIVLCEFLTGVGGIVCQFLIAIGLGFVSGVFYPVAFFPRGVQRLTAVLPLGAAFSYTRKLLSHTMDTGDLMLVLAYCILFFVIACIVRKYKISGDKKI